MPERMLAALGDLLENPAIPGGAELLELAALVERAERAMSGRDRNIPGSQWIGRRFLELVGRRMAGKTISRNETLELIGQIDDHGEWLAVEHGYDIRTDGWVRTHRALAHIAATADVKRRGGYQAACRRRQAAAYGLLTAAVLSPATWWGIRGDLPL